MFRAHKAERDGGFILHVIHISGKRMKASEVDGLSQGDLMEGMMGRKDPLSFIPFHLGADKWANGLVGTWVRSWWRTKKGAEFGGLALTQVTMDNMFELRDLKAASGCSHCRRWRSHWSCCVKIASPTPYGPMFLLYHV